MPLDLLERRNTTGNLKRRLGHRAERDFLELGAWNLSGWQDDFQGDLFSSGAAPGMYQSTASGAASAAAAVSTGVVNGAALLDAGTDNAGRSDLSWGLHYQAQLNAVYVARFSINTLTTRKFEIGFTDVLSGTDAGAVNVKATPTFTADNAVVLCYDTNDDTNLTLMGVKATVAATVADFSTALVAATYYYFGVALFGDDNARGFLLDANGSLLEEEVIEDCVTATTPLTPWLFVQNRAGNAGSMTLDWHKAYQRRTTTI
jgi:hypothetical protein